MASVNARVVITMTTSNTRPMRAPAENWNTSIHRWYRTDVLHTKIQVLNPLYVRSAKMSCINSRAQYAITTHKFIIGNLYTLWTSFRMIQWKTQRMKCDMKSDFMESSSANTMHAWVVRNAVYSPWAATWFEAAPASFPTPWWLIMRPTLDTSSCRFVRLWWYTECRRSNLLQ